MAGQASLSLADSDDRKARKLAERATELAPDSGHVWTARARVESAVGEEEEALDAWQRAWELAPAAGHVLVPEAWQWATHAGRTADLMERMLASLRVTQSPLLVVALAERVARQHPDQAGTALDRVAQRSAAARLELVRVRLSRGHREQARDAALGPLCEPSFLCRRCGTKMARFRFRCDSCSVWDCASVEGVDPEVARPERVAGLTGVPPARSFRRSST